MSDFHPTNLALADEIEAINSIYGIDTIKPGPRDTDTTQAILQLPNQPFSFSVTFDFDYPSSPPHINSTESISTSSKGQGTAALRILQDIISHVWTPGQVCLFDIIEEGGALLGDNGETEDARVHDEDRSAEPAHIRKEAGSNLNTVGDILPPNWVLSETVIEKKSIFIARCCAAASKEEAASSLTHLLSTNKKVASATHNITAWRMQNADNGTVVQDCDDDGESAAGGRLLHLMQLMDVWNVVLVVTRHYGGVKLGPDRFRIINAVARDSLVKGGFAKSEEEKSAKKKGKK